MKVLLANIPWYDQDHPDLWGVKAGSRWPHFQHRPDSNSLPRYIPFPFFMAIAANELKQSGHQVRLIDGIAEGMLLEPFFKAVEEFQPDVFFTETSTPSLDYDLAILKQLKARLPETIYICGGTHTAADIQALLQEHNLPDYWLAGEYETSLKEFINSNLRQQVPGLISTKQPFSNLASVAEPDALAAPLFEQLPIQNYVDPVCGLPTPNAQTWLSRNCPYRCSFCVWPQLIYGNRHYRIRSIDKALDEVETLIHTYGCESFYFDDDTTNIGEKRMVELAAKIKDRGLNQYPWAMMARADCMTDTMLAAFADAGIYAIKYGVESISPQLINSCNKGTDLAKLLHTLDMTGKYNIKTHLTFTFGLPGETPETIKETMDFAIQTAPESAQFSICTPFPGTEFFDECKRRGWLTTNEWHKFLGSGENVVVNTPTLSANKLKTEYRAALKRWQKFLQQRHQKRQQTLKSRLQSACNRERKWLFIGEREMAAFLCHDPALNTAFAGDISTNYKNYLQNEDMEDTIIVIASRHDEEKLYRRLQRSGFKEKDGNLIVRLYN